MANFDLVKVFSFAAVPPDLRDDDVFAELRANAGRPEYDQLIWILRVGQYGAAAKQPSNRCVTHAEWFLHRWLKEQGASEGEDVFLK